MAAMIIFVITFILSMISVVEERVNGTLQRMFINGVSKSTIIIGYILGYLIIATVQSIIVIVLTISLFELDLDRDTTIVLFLALWLLAIASVSLGLLISSFVRRQVQIIPFIPLVMLPTIFLSGIIADPKDLPQAAQYIGQVTPLYYANNIIDSIYDQSWAVTDIAADMMFLGIIILVIIIAASLTLRPVE